MRTARAVALIPFLLAAALLAAAVGDPLVESIAASGLVGPGYHDTDRLGVLPTLMFGLLLAAQVAAVRCAELLRPHDGRWALRAAALRFAHESPLRAAPVVFGLQLATVFVLQAGEHWIATGQADPGSAWLGGPVLFSLAVHAALAVTVTVALAALLRALLHAVVTIVRVAVALVARRRAGHGVYSSRRRGLGGAARTGASHARRRGDRAPPIVLAFASR